MCHDANRLRWGTEEIAVTPNPEVEVVSVEGPVELDGITPLQGFTPSNASMNPEGFVIVDCSDVTVHDYIDVIPI